MKVDINNDDMKGVNSMNDKIILAQRERERE